MARFHPSVKAGALFPQAGRTSFNDLTRSRYAGMCARFEKKQIPPPPFSLDQFRADILSVMGDKEDGVILCRYCNRYFTIEDIAVDHATPLSRGGSAALDNIDYPCKSDNNRKGSMSMNEYAQLLSFLETVHPLMRKDILSRLEKANSLAASARRGIMLASKLKAPSNVPPEPEDDPMGPF